MSTVQGKRGVWVLYILGEGNKALKFHDDPVQIILDLANEGYGNIAFWPMGMSLDEALEWWNELIANGYSVPEGVTR